MTGIMAFLHKQERLRGTSLGQPAYRTSKDIGDHSMLVKRRMAEGAKAMALQDLCDKAKGRLLQVQS